MPLVQKLLCTNCSNKFNIYFIDENISIKDAYRVECPKCKNEIEFIDGFGTSVENIPKDGVVALKIT